MIAPSGQVKIKPSGSEESEELSLGRQPASGWCAILGTDHPLKSWKYELESEPGSTAAKCVFRGLDEDSMQRALES